MANRLPEALAALRRGEIVCLYDADGREGETDMVVASEFATPDAIRRLRTEAGGLLCTTVAPEHHRLLGLPFLADLLAGMAQRHPVLAHLAADDLRYDPSKSSFGLTVNARGTFTGIPDADRSLTIRELAWFLGELEGKAPQEAQRAFGAAFRAPGHVALLNAAEGGLARRQGHTELSLELARMAGLLPSTTICEMLDGNPERSERVPGVLPDGNPEPGERVPGTSSDGQGRAHAPPEGRALGRKAAQAYAQRHGLVFLTGQDVLDAWTDPTRLPAIPPPASHPPARPAPVPRVVARVPAPAAVPAFLAPPSASQASTPTADPTSAS